MYANRLGLTRISNSLQVIVAEWVAPQLVAPGTLRSFANAQFKLTIPFADKQDMAILPLRQNLEVRVCDYCCICL